MTATLTALTAALADRYHLDHEPGQGGMATVYRTHELRRYREMALQVPVRRGLDSTL